MKAYFTYGPETREGFSAFHPSALATIATESVDEIQAENVLERVPDLVDFIEQCYRVLKKDGTCTFSAPFFASNRAWVSPLTKRAISEYSLSFANKKWREDNKYCEIAVVANFEVTPSFNIEDTCLQRSDEARQFWMYRYINVVHAVFFVLKKISPDAN